MNCSIATCPNRPVAQVTFAVTGATYAYCQWHGYRKGVLRWPDSAISNVERVR